MYLYISNTQVYFSFLHFIPIGPFLFMCAFFSMDFISWILEATGDEEWDRRALPTSWIFFSDFVFFRLLIGKELTLVRVIWAREAFFTRWRLIPGLSSNLWPEHQLKIQRVSHSVSQSVSKQVSKQSAVIQGPEVRVLFTEHLNKSYIMFSMRNAFHHMAASWSPERNTQWVNEVRGCLWIYVRKLFVCPAIIHSRNPLTFCYFTSIQLTVSSEKIWITWYSIQWGNLWKKKRNGPIRSRSMY